MLGLGWTEMLVIGLAALIFIGPKDLPVVMNRAGKIIAQIRRMGNEFQREINKTTGLDEVRNLRNSITAPLKKTTDEIRKEFNAMTPTGVQPSGVIKPANPKVESVVDQIRAAAGMPAASTGEPVASTAVAKTNDEIAAEAGFKPSAKPASAKPAAARKAPVKANPAPTRPVITTDLKPIAEPVAEAPAKVAVAKKPATRKPAAAAKPAAEAKPATAKKPAARKSPAAAKPVEAAATPAPSATEKPVKKPAVRKAPAAKAVSTTDAAKAGDE